MKYKALLVDADDTLLDFQKTELEALLPVLEKYNIPTTKENIETYSRINLSYWKKLENKELNHQEVIIQRWSEYFSLFNLECDPFEINKDYFDLIKNGAHVVEDAIEFLNECNKYMDVYIITNGSPQVQYNRLEKSGISKLVKHSFISLEIGYNKPNSKFFDYVFLKTGLKNTDCIVLGDSLSSDIQGAINSNIDYVLFDRFDKHKDFKGKRITKLLDFFKKIEE